MNEPLHQEEYKGYKIKLFPDDDPMNPRNDCENFETMVCFHRRYNLGDVERPGDSDDYLRNLAGDCRTPIDTDNASMETIWKIVSRHYLILELGLLDHSGLHMWVGGGSHWSDAQGWDSGTIGFIYVSHAKICKEYGVKSVRHCVLDQNKRRVKAIDMAERALRSEVFTYDAYLTGNVIGRVTEDREGNEIDSCWGYFPESDTKGGWLSEFAYVIAEAKSGIDYHIKHEASLHCKALKAKILNKVGLNHRVPLEV